MKNDYLSKQFLQEGLFTDTVKGFLFFLLGYIHIHVVKWGFDYANKKLDLKLPVKSHTLGLLFGIPSYIIGLFIADYFRKRMKYGLLSCGLDLDCKIKKLEDASAALEVSKKLCEKSKDPDICLKEIEKQQKEIYLIWKEYKQDRYKKEKRREE